MSQSRADSLVDLEGIERQISNLQNHRLKLLSVISAIAKMEIYKKVAIYLDSSLCLQNHSSDGCRWYYDEGGDENPNWEKFEHLKWRKDANLLFSRLGEEAL